MQEENTLHNFDTILLVFFSRFSFSRHIVHRKGAYNMTNQSITAEPAGITSAEAKPKRYHPALVALHWLVVILIFSNFLLAQANQSGEERFEGPRGFPPPQGIQQGNPPPQDFDADEAPQGFPQGGNVESSPILNIHMIVGITILVLLVVRLIVRWTTKHPEWAGTGNKFLDWIGGLTHFGLYLLTFGMTITGIILANQRGILARVFGVGSTGWGGFGLGFLHGGIWVLLSLLIILHIGAALYHQFILKDNLLGRMWFGKREE